MGWELTDFRLTRDSGLASIFQFEIVFPAADHVAWRLIRGDGFLLRGQQVRFNREDELRQAVTKAGIDPQHVLAQLADEAIQHSRRLELQPS